MLNAHAALQGSDKVHIKLTLYHARDSIQLYNLHFIFLHQPVAQSRLYS